jgi:hypothetical protein
MMNNWFDSQTVHVAVDDENDNYPIQDDIRTGESGQGYVLRMTRSNFLPGLSEIRKRCGKQFSTSLTSVDAHYISKWFGADLIKMKAALEESDVVINEPVGAAPGQLAVVQRELEVTVGLERDEAFGTPAAEVEGLVETDVLKVTRVQVSEQEVVSAVVQARAGQDLPAGGNRVRYVNVAEGQAFKAETDAGELAP